MRGRPGPSDLWGKFRSPERGGPAWHPLVDHATDVACVLEALLAEGSPAPAGMDRFEPPTVAEGFGLPRTRGDGPSTHDDLLAVSAAPPHPRGWTLLADG